MISIVPQARISVRVQPRARADAIVDLREDVLIVRVRAPPLDGRANSAVCRLLAGALGVQPSSVSIARGRRSRDKAVVVEGIDQAAADAALRLALGRRQH